jgi:hypothetical protein
MSYRSAWALALSLAWLPSALAAGKPVLNLPVAGALSTPGQQLQDAVNNPANAGTRIRLARGHYVLDPAKPNGGRLFLYPGTEIVGENAYVDCDHDGVWDSLTHCLGSGFTPDRFTLADSETLIDGTGITGAATGNPAVMRIGDDNVVSRVTVLAPRRSVVAGSIDINLPSASGRLGAIVTDSIVRGGQRGIRGNNGVPARSGITLSAVISRNIVHDNQPVPGGTFSFGIQIQNNAATGSSWQVVLLNNRVYGNRFGYFIVANGSQGAAIDILSLGNLVRDNELGMFIGAGFAPAGAPAGDSSSNGNVRFTSSGDRIEENVTPVGNLASFMNTGGGIVAFAAGRDSAVAGICSRNNIRLQFLNTTFRGNKRVDNLRHMTLYGSLSSAVAGPDTGTDNVLTLLMLATDSDVPAAAYVLDASDPDDPTGTNRARVLASDVHFENP